MITEEKRIEICDRHGQIKDFAHLSNLLEAAVKKAEILGFSIWFVGPHPSILPNLLKGYGFKLLGFETANANNPQGQSFWVRSPIHN